MNNDKVLTKMNLAPKLAPGANLARWIQCHLTFDAVLQ